MTKKQQAELDKQLSSMTRAEIAAEIRAAVDEDRPAQLQGGVEGEVNHQPGRDHQPPPHSTRSGVMSQPKGRPVNTNLERTTVSLPCDLKLTIAIRALERGETISAFIATALRERIAALGGKS